MPYKLSFKAIYQAILALTDDTTDKNNTWEILIPTPYWGPYKNMVTSSTAKSIFVDTSSKNNYKLTHENISSKINTNSRILILCSPHNPTGIVYSQEELLMISKICDQYPNLYIIWDEIYSDLILDSNYKYERLIKVAPHLKERIITINGFSKAYAMTGFRIGYALANRELIQKMAFYQGQITSSAGFISQKAGILSLEEYEDGNYLSTINKTLLSYVLLFDQCFQKIAGLKYTRPVGGMYIYVDLIDLGITDSRQWCCDIISKYHVSFMPGIVFGDPTAIRICFAMDNMWIQRAIHVFQQEFT